MCAMASRDIRFAAQSRGGDERRSRPRTEGVSGSRPRVRACSGRQDDRPGSTGEASDLIREREEARRVIDRLAGRVIPPLLLATSRGEPVDLGSFATRSVVVYMYPGSSSSPDGGEDSPMLDAAQHRAYGAHEPDMSALNLSVFGVSSQSPDAQRESAEATRVRHALLSDSNLLLAEKLDLPIFEDRGARWYRRLTMVVRHGRIGKVFYPMRSPARNPAEVVAWTKVQAQ
jgi:peroxiredoxin